MKPLIALLFLVASPVLGQTLQSIVNSSPPSSGPVCGSYLHYRVITIPAQTALSGNLSNYPVIISSTYSYLATVANGGLVQNSSGFDVGFFTDNTCGTKLPWEVETYTATTGLVNYWVQVPSISKTSSVTFVMAYDNAGVTTDQSNPHGVWDSNFLGVFHLPPAPSNPLADISAKDSTSNANDGLETGIGPTAGQIDGAANYVSANTIFVPFVNPAGSGRTYQGWFFATSFPDAYNSAISKDVTGGNTNNYTLLVKSTGLLAGYVDATGALVDYDGTGTHTLLVNTWYFLTLTYDSTAGLIGYVNGAVDGTAAANGTLPNGNTGTPTTEIGNADVASRDWLGKIDETRFSNIARSADWILTDYNSQSAPTSFYSVGSQH